MFAIEFNRRFAGLGVTANAVHPGTFVHTGIGRHWWIFRLASLLATVVAKTIGQVRHAGPIRVGFT